MNTVAIRTRRKKIDIREDVFHVEIIDDCVFFKYLVPKGEAYDKKNTELLKKADK